MRSASRGTPATEATPAATAAAGGGGLDRALRPRSVAVIGASADPTKRGHQIVRALVEGGWDGTVHPVNPRGGTLLGVPVLQSVAALPEGVDLAVVCTPAGTAAELVEACGERGVGAALVLAVGFGEAGDAGRAEELKAAAQRSGIRVLGPNTSGLLDVPAGLNLIGLQDVPPGRLTLAVQSGNVLLEQVTRARTDGGEGFQRCVGLGNMLDVDWADLLDHLGAPDGDGPVLLYAEGFGRGRAMVEAAARTSRGRPIALLVGGRSSAGVRAARSHTGALASRNEVVDAALRAAGIIRLERSDELRAVGTALAWQPPAGPGGVAVLADGGGHGTLAADALARLDAPLATLSDATRSALRERLGPAAAVSNPVDVAGATDADPGAFADATRILLTDEGVGSLLVVGLFGGYALRFGAGLESAETAAAEDVAETARTAGRGLVVHSLYSDADTAPIQALRRAHVPVVGSLEGACRAVAALVERRRVLDRPPLAPLPTPRKEGGAALAAALEERRSALREPETRALVAPYGVPMVPAVECETAQAAARAADGAGGAVAVRLVSSVILHRTAAGGVRLGVRGAGEAMAAFEAIRDAAASFADRNGLAGVPFEGVLVSPMQPPPAAELIVGARRDPVFGPVLLVGRGGVRAEETGDVALELLPCDQTQVLEALGRLRSASALRASDGGARPLRGTRADREPEPHREPEPDLEAVADLALRLAECLMDNPEVTDLEANPVFAYAGGAVAVDLRALVDPEEP